jgi:zinc/manganese transport system permease protein
VFSSLIIPALATRAYLGKRRLAMGYALGALGYGIGLALSAILDLPSGAVIVWALAACAMAFAGIRSASLGAVDTAQPTSRSS